MYKNARIIAIYPTNFRVFRPGKDFEVICNLATTITYVIIYVRGDTYNFRNQLTLFFMLRWVCKLHGAVMNGLSKTSNS